MQSELTRRGLLIGGATVSAAALGAAGATALAASAPPQETVFGSERLPFYGEHQTGVSTTGQAHTRILAFDLVEDADASGIRRMLELLTDDAARLTQGVAPLADIEPELTHSPARLTITFAFGAELVRRVAPSEVPVWLQPLPAFSIDQLDETRCGGDFAVLIAGDDPLTISHAARMVERDTRTFALPRWQQHGSRRARGTESAGTTMRNHFGQVDGSENPSPGGDAFEASVWIPGGVFAGGTSLVFRQIAMHLDTWDEVGRHSRELAVGRRLTDGAPITGGTERDAIDLEAQDSRGLPIVPMGAHARRARAATPTQQMFRASWNTDLPEVGLAFCAFQADPLTQFVPVQERLAALDVLNLWTTPVGSAVFVVPPGCSEGSFIGAGLFGEE